MIIMLSCNMDLILVNATAARSSGALSILNQFIDHIKLTGENQYCIFVDVNYKERVHGNNIKYVHIDTKSWIRRLKWDMYGFRKYVLKENCSPCLIISFQNTGVRFSNHIPQLIYYHQLLPLSSKSWSLFKKNEIVLFLYKYIYRLFVSYSIHENVSFVVQIPSVKNAFLRRFHIFPDRVYVIPPEVPTIDYGGIDEFVFDDGKKHFIYPASPVLYKNHELLLRVLSLIKERDSSLYKCIKLHFTLHESNALHLKKMVSYLELDDAIVFEGVLPYQKLLSYYKSMDALVFPSYIESFGLPLLEAAGAGIAIVASDLPYVHDVVGEYEGVTYCDCEDVNAWASAIESLCVHEKNIYSSFQYSNDKGNWNDFFLLINKLKIKN